jgi:hypothetical protein
MELASLLVTFGVPAFDIGASSRITSYSVLQIIDMSVLGTSHVNTIKFDAKPERSLYYSSIDKGRQAKVTKGATKRRYI